MVIMARARGSSDASRARSSFIPRSESPGPAAHEVVESQIRTTAPRAVFGSASRDVEQARYISPLHSAALPPGDTPGPGTYRHVHSRYPHHPHHSPAGTYKFGTAAQRTRDEEVVAARSPGPIYSLPQGGDPSTYAFSSLSSPKRGALRQRSEGSRMFISQAHSLIDREGTMDEGKGAGPGQYDVSSFTSLSPKRRAPDVGFGRRQRDLLKDTLWPQQLAVEPRATTALETPSAAHYSPVDPATVRPAVPSMVFGTGPRTYAPEKGSSAAGPYLSRLHEESALGATSPGPGAYTLRTNSPRTQAVAGWLGDAPHAKFGTEVQHPSARVPVGPGPGAYSPTHMRAASAPAHSLAPALRPDVTAVGPDPTVPGPGAYNVEEAARCQATSKHAPAYSLGALDAQGRASYIAPTPSPGPAYGGLAGAIDSGPGKGYSFGLREHTIDKGSMVSVRFHGPLAAMEGQGTQSPGPGVYNVSSTTQVLSRGRRVADFSFGSAPRSAGSRLYVSRQHAQADGSTILSPGPGAYDHGSIELSQAPSGADVAQVTSRFAKAPNAAFGTSSRFNQTYMTF
ncbi:hypothetical protein QJQ45_020361 [Haematococcus lacustris]|nr:hypothetical protein QJQ45_020361 [Haematococcus lacustris]